MSNNNGLIATSDVAGSGNPDSVYFIRKGNPVVIDDLIANNITCDTIDLNGGTLTTTTGGTVLTLNGNPIGGIATITGTIPINVTAGVNPIVSLNDSAVTPGTYTVATITVDSKGIVTNAVSNVIPPNDDWSNFPAQTNVDMDNHVINNLATPLVATDGATKGYVDTLDANNVKLTGDQTIAGIKTFSSVPVCATMPTNNDQLANKQYVDMAIGADTLANVLIAGNSAGANQINMNNNKIVNCLNPTDPQDVATKSYVDALPTETLTATLIAGNSAGANQINMNNNKIVNCLNPTDPQDVATKNYVDTLPAETLTTTLIAGNSAGANQINMNSNKIVNCLNPTDPQDVATKDYVDGISVTPTLAQVLTAGNTANMDINMNDFDISSVNDITMSGLAPTITATNILGNLTLSALGTFNALTGGQMTLASGGIMSIGGATYTSIENVRINNSVITKEPATADLSISDVATLNIVGSGNINYATDTLINNTTGVVKINSIAQATPALTNVLAYDPVSHEVKYQANSGGTVTGVTATTPILSSGGSAPVISHATSGVVPATYTNATVTVNAEGHITSATNGTAPITTINGTAPIVANTVAGTTTVSHATSGVVAGSYTSANITVNAEGHITTATNGTTPATPTLSAVLTAGNTSGANHIVMDAGQNVDVTSGEVFAGTLNVNVIEPLAPAISTEIGIVGSLVFPGVIEMRNNGAGGGIGLKIDSIPSGTTTNVLGYDTVTNQITYQPASTGSITSITGTSPINANTVGGATTVSHANSGVVANTYTNATVTVNATGHITSATSGTAPVTSVGAGTGISITGTPTAPIVNNTGILAVAGTAGNVSANTVAGTATVDLVNAGTAGTYAYPTSVTTDVKGRVTAITAGTAPVPPPVLSVSGTAGEIEVSPTTGNCVVGLPSLGTAGTFTNPASITTDANGRVSAITSGSAPITSIIGTTPIVANTVGGATTVSHANSGVVAGSYTSANITVDATGHITSATNGSAPATPTLAQVLVAGNTSGASDILMDPGQKIDVETITSVQTITGSPITNGIQIKTLSNQRQLVLNDATNEAKLTVTAGPNIMEHYTESGPIPKSGIRYTNGGLGIDRRVEVGFDGTTGYTNLRGIQQSLIPKDYVIGFDNTNERIFYQETPQAINDNQIVGDFQVQTDITTVLSGKKYYLLRNTGINTSSVFNSMADGNTSDIPFFRRDGSAYPGVPISVGSAPWGTYPAYPDANMEVRAMDTNPFDGSVYVGAYSLVFGGSIIYQFFPDINVWNQIVFIDDNIQSLFFDRESDNLYYGGKFSQSEASPGSPVSTKMVGYYQGGSVNQLQTGLDNGVFAITRWNGYIALGGAFKFDNTGSGAYFERFALYDPNTNDFYTLGQTTGAGGGDYGFDASVYTLAVLPQTNTLVIGGEFNQSFFAGSPAFYPKLNQYDLLNGLNGVADNSLSGNAVVKLLADYEGKRLYILGDFTTSSGSNFVATNINTLQKFLDLGSSGIINQAPVGSTLTKDEVGGYIWIFDNNNQQMWRYDPNAEPSLGYEYMNGTLGITDALCFGFYSWYDKAVHFWLNGADGYYRYFCDQRVKERLPPSEYFEIDGYRYNTVVLTKKGSTATILGEAGNPVWGVISKTPDVYFEWDTAQLRLVEPAYATALCLQTIGGISGPTSIPWTDVKGRNVGINSPSNGKLNVRQKGLYKMSYSVQLDNSAGGNIDVYIWFVVNGRKFQQTNTKFVVDGPNAESAPFVEVFVELDVDDWVGLIVDSPSGTLEIPSTVATASQPAIPGVIFNIQLIQPSKEFYTTV